MKNNKFTYYYFAIALFIGILVACGGETEKEEHPENIQIAEPGEDTTTRVLGFFDRSLEPYTEYNLKRFKHVKRKNKNVLNFVQTPSGLLFLAQSKSELTNNNGEFDKDVRFGLYSETGERILDVDYELISNPGMIADGHVEFKQNGKYGLFNYTTNKIIEAEYDVIFPSPIMEYIAIGVKNDRYYKIYLDGKNKPFAEDQNVISYAQLLQNHPLNYDADYYGMWYHTEGFEYLEDDSYYEEYTPRTIIPASYFEQLELYPKVAKDIYGTYDSLSVSLSKIKELPTKKKGFISTVFERISDGRGYEETVQRLHLVSKANRSVKNIILTNDGNTYGINVYADSKRTAKFINDSLVEVRNFIPTENKAIAYSYLTHYEFISISKSGNTKKSDRGVFPMTEIIELKPYHFQGGFIRFVTEEKERMMTPDYNEEWQELDVICITNHLTAEDLRYMINEMYARHGLKFKNPELTATFKKYKWYKPQFTNVDSKLNEIEKKNLNTILKLEKELKSNPSKYIKRTYQYYVQAG